MKCGRLRGRTLALWSRSRHAGRPRRRPREVLAAWISVYYIWKCEPRFDLMRFSIYSRKAPRAPEFCWTRGNIHGRRGFQGWSFFFFLVQVSLCGVKVLSVYYFYCVRRFVQDKLALAKPLLPNYTCTALYLHICGSFILSLHFYWSEISAYVIFIRDQVVLWLHNGLQAGFQED